jgi:lipoyl(octanoyl) transferase
MGRGGVGVCHADVGARGHDVPICAGTKAWVITRSSMLPVKSEGRVGVWVHGLKATNSGATCRMRAAIGIRLRDGSAFMASPLMWSRHSDHFDGIVPCGITELSLSLV